MIDWARGNDRQGRERRRRYSPHNSWKSFDSGSRGSREDCSSCEVALIGGQVAAGERKGECAVSEGFELGAIVMWMLREAPGASS